jgi:hypothetical protein
VAEGAEADFRRLLGEENQGVEGPGLRADGAVAPDGQVREERSGVRRAEVHRVTFGTSEREPGQEKSRRRPDFPDFP